jgi:hypothetical protein
VEVVGVCVYVTVVAVKAKDGSVLWATPSGWDACIEGGEGSTTAGGGGCGCCGRGRGAGTIRMSSVGGGVGCGGTVVRRHNLKG